MTDRPDSQDDFASEIFGDVEYTRPQPEPKRFMPWHRPRKQFVRREQWTASLQSLYADREPGDPLRYLGLPGTDLIDLRYLHQEICLPYDRPMWFLGFNSEARPGKPAHDELKISLDEVLRLPNVDAKSDVIPDDFQQIGVPDSVAWQRTQKLGPFDVVNIDLCNGLASESPTINGSIYQALAQLAAFQARNPDPWLLLVTTRIGRGMFDADAEARLVNRILENVANCEGFAEACEDLLELDVQSIESAAYCGRDLLNLMTVAIGKWLSALVQANGPSNVKLASTHGYRVNPVAVCEDLVSLALRFDPVIEAPSDPFSPTPPEPIDECATAKDILRQTTERLNVDNFLEMRPDLLEELTSEMEQMLALARYQIAGYRRWLEN